MFFSHVPIQQTHIDLHSTPQKLSKIETLRLARNYIIAMSQTLREGKPMDIGRFVAVLSQELSQTTANLLAGTLMGPSTLYKRPGYENNINFSNEEQCLENPYTYWYNNSSCRFTENYSYNRYFDEVRYWESDLTNRFW